MKPYLIAALILFLSSSTMAHPGHDDPVLAELNDYLMAIQVMRIDHPRAAEIFKTWHQLRTESWKIRELTDQKDFLINASEVVDQIAATREKRKQLLQECKTFFLEIIQSQPAIRVDLDEEVTIDWDDPVLEVPGQESRVLLVKIENRRDHASQIKIGAEPNDHVRFWNKRFTMEPNTSRFTYVLCAPLAQESFSNTLTIQVDPDLQAQTQVRVKGLKPERSRYALKPGETIYRVQLPEEQEPYKSVKDMEGDIQFRIKDNKGNPVVARVEVRDQEGNAYWSPLSGPAFGVGRSEGSFQTELWEYQPGPYFYVGGIANLDAEPRGKKATVYRGFEYLPVKADIPEDGQVEVVLKRWINMKELGWFSGHTHIHTTDAGMPVQFTPHWAMIAQAEDLNVSAILTLKGEWETHAIYANEFPMGLVKTWSTRDHIIFYGEEYRNNPYGHVAFVGLDNLVQPISSGAVGELGGPDYPPNSYVLEEALDQGATTIGAHFGNFITRGESIGTVWPSSGFEMPVDVALGRIQLAEIYGNGGQQEVWYDLLNCGFRVPATAGPDWAVRDCPRVYVHLDGKPFNLENWINYLEQGRSFITTGPMLSFEANGLMPGSEIKVTQGPVEISVKANALVPNGNLPVEIVFNGKMIAKGTDVNAKVTITDSGWLAARCQGAHSNPVYVAFAGRPAGLAAPALKYVAVTDRLAEWVSTKGLFDHESQKEEVLVVLEEGKKIYQGIADRARELGRE